MYILSHHVTSSHEIQFVAEQTKQTCSQIFLKSVFLSRSKKSHYTNEEFNNLKNFSETACHSNNPDIIWQIAYVESGFEMNIVGIPGKNKLVGRDAVNYVQQLNKPLNVDIGPMQVNWRSHGFKSGYNPELFFNGTFSLKYISKNIIQYAVRGCKSNWVNCYNSWNPRFGSVYRVKIDKADLVLRRNLFYILKQE